MVQTLCIGSLEALGLPNFLKLCQLCASYFYPFHPCTDNFRWWEFDRTAIPQTPSPIGSVIASWSRFLFWPPLNSSNECRWCGDDAPAFPIWVSRHAMEIQMLHLSAHHEPGAICKWHHLGNRKPTGKANQSLQMKHVSGRIFHLFQDVPVCHHEIWWSDQITEVEC